jgi:hypothetical protein
MPGKVNRYRALNGGRTPPFFRAFFIFVPQGKRYANVFFFC